MRNEVFLLLEEAGQIGHMTAIDQAITLLRGHGVRVILLFQSVGQLHETFRGRASVVLDNCEQIYFGLNGYETVERVSKMLGDSTITVEDASEQESRGRQRGGHDQSLGGVNVTRSSTRSWKVQARALLKPEEVLQMNGDYLIAFLRNVRPICARRMKWHEEPALGGRVPRRKTTLVWWALMAASVGLLVWSALGR